MSLWIWLQEMSAGGWAILGIALIVLELVTASSYLLWPGLAALVVALIHWLVPMPAGMPYVLFAVLSVVATLVGRRYYNPRQVSTDEPELNQISHRHIGKIYVLDDDTHGGRGVVRVGDSRWQVDVEGATDLPRGTRVEVLAQHDTRLVVRAASAVPH